MQIPSTDFQQNVGKYMALAQHEPVLVLRHGKPYLVMISAAMFEAHWGAFPVAPEASEPAIGASVTPADQPAVTPVDPIGATAAIEAPPGPSPRLVALAATQFRMGRMNRAELEALMAQYAGRVGRAEQAIYAAVMQTLHNCT